MTEQLKQQLYELVKRNQFDAVYQLCKDERISFISLRILYKQNQAIFKSNGFWQSKLPHFYLPDVLTSDLNVTFWENYLEHDSFSNDELNRHLLILNADEFVQHFKLNKCFLKDRFWASLQRLVMTVSGLDTVIDELKIIADRLKRIDKEEMEDNFYFSQFNIGELLQSFTLYYHQYKQQPEIAGNKSHQTEIEVALVTELNRVLTLHKGKSTLALEYSTNSEIQKHFERYSAPHHKLGKRGLLLPVDEKTRFLYMLIDKAIARQSKRGAISLYITGYSSFESNDSRQPVLQTNERYRLFQLDNYKSSPEEYYFSKIKLENLRSLPKRTDTSASIDVLNFYGIPLEVLNNTKKISIEKALSLLKYFSVYKGPEEKTFSPNGSYIINNTADSAFTDLFGTNESITIFNCGKLVKDISNYFKWEVGEASTILEFLTLDLRGGCYPNSWLSRPFLKLDDNIIWLGSLLKDRRWDNVFINRLKQEYEHKGIITDLSANLELKVEETFAKTGFNTISRLIYKSLDGQRGDFDVLAYKDNTLFVCEVKSGWRSDDFSYATFLELYRLDGCASDQLNKGLAHLKEDWDSIKVKLKINEVIRLEEITVIPMIVTDYFEGDNLLYRGVYRKVSLLELEVIFKNRKKQLLETYLWMKKFLDQNNLNLRSFSSEEITWDLWNGKRNIDIPNLLDVIEKNEIWKEMLRIWKFSSVSYTI
jgi:hypothetical protein